MELSEYKERIKNHVANVLNVLPSIKDLDRLRAIKGASESILFIIDRSLASASAPDLTPDLEEEESEEEEDLHLGLETNAYTKLAPQVASCEKDGLTRSKTPQRRVTDLYSQRQLARVWTCVETVLNELEMSYESLAIAINRAAGEHRCTKDSLNRLARIGKDVDRGPATNQPLMGLLDLAYVSRIYTEEDLRAIALGNPPVTETALSYHPEDRLPGPIEEKVSGIVGAARDGKDRITAIERGLEILVRELKKESARLELIEREMSEKK